MINRRDEWVTPEQVLKTYEFKLVKTALKRRYPWIKDVVLDDPNDINKWTLIFLTLKVDINKLVEAYGYPLRSWTHDYIKEKEIFRFSFISSATDMPGDEARQILDDMNQELKQIHMTKSVPEELKLPKNRSFNVTDFCFNC